MVCFIWFKGIIMLIISRYVLTQYIKAMLSVILVIFSFLIMLSGFDNAHKFRSANFGLLDLIKLIFYKSPYLISEISPMIALLSTLFLLNKFTSTNQLSNIFSSGFSVMLIAKITSFVNLIFGLIILFCIGPLGSLLLYKYEAFEKKLTYTHHLAEHLILKESISQENRFIYIEKINFNTKIIENVTFLILQNDMFANRLNCKTAVINNYHWQLQNCTKSDINNKTQNIAFFDFNTKLNVRALQDYFLPIYSMPFWKMPKIIRTTKQLGIKTQALELSYYKQLLRPIFILLIGLVPFYFFRARRDHMSQSILDSIISGGILMFCSSIVTNFLTQHINSSVICNLIPIILLLLLSTIKLWDTYKHPI